MESTPLHSFLRTYRGSVFGQSPFFTLTNEELLARYGPLYDSCSFCEDYSRWMFEWDEIIAKVQQIEHEVKILMLDSGTRRFLRCFVNDLACFASLVPSIIIKHDGACILLWLHLLAIHLQ
jgi:hypothetical protein